MITPCHESSPTHSHLPKPCMRKIIIFKTKLLFLKIYYRSIRYKYGTTLRGELVGELSETVMVLIRNDLLAHLKPNSPEYHPLKFLSQPYPFLQKIPCHALTPNSRLPSAYENALCHFQNHLHNMSICIFSINYNYTHVIQHINHHSLSSIEQFIIISNDLYTQLYSI